MIEVKEGVYISKHGKLKTFHINPITKILIVDEGKAVSHPLFRFKYFVVHECSPNFPLLDQFGPLYKCEYLGEL